jgi:hypothetical protein
MFESHSVILSRKRLEAPAPRERAAAGGDPLGMADIDC